MYVVSILGRQHRCVDLFLSFLVLFAKFMGGFWSVFISVWASQKVCSNFAFLKFVSFVCFLLRFFIFLVMRYHILVTLHRGVLRKVARWVGFLGWILCCPPPNCPSSLGLSCVRVCPCCRALMYLHGIPFPYTIVQRIPLSIHPNAPERSISISWIVLLRSTPFSICESTSSVALLCLYAVFASSVSKFSRCVSLFPRMHSHILKITLRSAMGL